MNEKFYESCSWPKTMINIQENLIVANKKLQK